MCDSPLYGIFWKVTYYSKALNRLVYEKYDLVNWEQGNKPQNEKLSKFVLCNVSASRSKQNSKVKYIYRK